MRSSVDAAAFYKAMTALMEVLSKSSISILREIKVEFTADQCVLSATDLDTWMSVTIPAGGDSFDFVFRNSANIQKVCRHFDGTLELDLQQCGDESFLTMRSGGKGGEFPVYDTKDCPVWPDFRVRQTYAANAAKILTCVKQVKYAVNPRAIKLDYQGVLFQNRHIWAVEGHRAACCDGGGLDVENPFLVGVSALEQLKAFGDADMQISVADEWVLFQNEHVRLLAKRIPKYLLACIGKADKPYVRFHNGTVSLYVNGCRYKAAVPISMESSIIFGFDIRYMLDALTQFEKQDMVTMQLTSSLGAISLVAGSSSAIVLPVRLREEEQKAA